MTREDVIKLMESSKSENEWNKNCDAVKAAFNGYPDFWFGTIVLSGLAKKVSESWSPVEMSRVNR